MSLERNIFTILGIVSKHADYQIIYCKESEYSNVYSRYCYSNRESTQIVITIKDIPSYISIDEWWQRFTNNFEKLKRGKLVLTENNHDFFSHEIRDYIHDELKPIANITYTEIMNKYLSSNNREERTEAELLYLKGEIEKLKKRMN